MFLVIRWTLGFLLFQIILSLSFQYSLSFPYYLRGVWFCKASIYSSHLSSSVWKSWNTVDVSVGGWLKYQEFLKKFSSEHLTMSSTTPSATSPVPSTNPATCTSSQPEHPKTPSSLVGQKSVSMVVLRILSIFIAVHRLKIIVLELSDDIPIDCPWDPVQCLLRKKWGYLQNNSVTMTKIGLISNSSEVKSYISIYTNSIPCYYLRHIHQIYMTNKFFVVQVQSHFWEQSELPKLQQPNSCKSNKAT